LPAGSAWSAQPVSQRPPIAPPSQRSNFPPRSALRLWIFAGVGYAGVYAPSYDTIESYLAENAKDGDAVIVMGAGSVTKLSDQLAVKLSRNGAA